MKVRRLASNQIDAFRAGFEATNGYPLEDDYLTEVEIWGLYRGVELIGGFTLKCLPARRFLDSVPEQIRPQIELVLIWRGQTSVTSTNCVWVDRRFREGWHSVAFGCALVLAAKMPGRSALPAAVAPLLALSAGEMGSDRSSMEEAFSAAIRPAEVWHETVEPDGEPCERGWSSFARRPGPVMVLCRLVVARVAGRLHRARRGR
jgi:hypothetical protein